MRRSHYRASLIAMLAAQNADLADRVAEREERLVRASAQVTSFRTPPPLGQASSRSRPPVRSTRRAY